MYDHNRQKIIYTQSAQIVSQIFILAHISACIFITVAQSSPDPATWIKKLKDVTEVTNPTAGQLYTSALYWSIITMVTLGYGDIVPIGQSEIINESKKNKNKLKNDLEMLNNLIEERNLNNELKHKVRRYFEYLYKEKQKNIEVAQEMIGNLPPNLKDEVMNDLYSKLIKQQPLFSTNFSEQFIYDLSLTVKEQKIGPELLIQKKNFIQDRLYIILKGEVGLYWEIQPNTSPIIETYNKGTILGLQEFITQTPVEYYSRSESVTSLGSIHFSEFLETLRKHPKDYEIYYKLKDKFNIYRESNCRVYCRFCKKAVHRAEDCPLLRYQPNLNKLIYQSKKLELVQQERNNNKKRAIRSKSNSRYILSQINDYAHKAANDLFNENQSVDLNTQYFKNYKSASKIEFLNEQQETNYTQNKRISQEEAQILQQYQQLQQQQIQSKNRRTSYQQNQFMRSTLDNQGNKVLKGSMLMMDLNNNFQTNPNSQIENRNFTNSQSQYDEHEDSMKSKDQQTKLQNLIDNGNNQQNQFDKQSYQQIPSMIMQKQQNNYLRSLEEIQEVVQGPNEIEASNYYSYKNREDSGDEQFEKQDHILNNNDFDQQNKIPTLIFVDYNNQNSPSRQIIQRQEEHQKLKERQQTVEKLLFNEKQNFDRIYPEDNLFSHIKERLPEKKKTFTNFLEDHDQRGFKRQYSNAYNFNDKHSTNANQSNQFIHTTQVNHSDNTPASIVRHPTRRRTSNNQPLLFNNHNQNPPLSPNNSQIFIQQPYFEEDFEYPLIQIPNFDKLQNYVYYFPHNNPRQILRNIEDKRLQYLERKRKYKIQKKTNLVEKSKFILQNTVSEKKL